MNTNIVYGPRAADLRDPHKEQELTEFMLNLGETDMMCFDAVQNLVQDWLDNGGELATASGGILDIERAEFTGELIIYDVNDKPVFLEPLVPLIRLEEAFGQSPRRCVNHMRAKQGQTSQRRVSVENLPRLFWIAVAAKIFTQIIAE
ncbi:hypothetical protein [Tateyamaria sp. ANG-S1]|uniref:hypothetical protein n=1 Tax=Tateyamaria sp. ANG-S1 TaxID=1577905 RepID=UPI00057DFDEF|nr:hypothetical protein [Tateyamaria sp. ANG-S1]KIC51044.1 hypothetical protein RA29_03965 [Tateyamaria sp. ANG-S1]